MHHHHVASHCGCRLRAVALLGRPPFGLDYVLDEIVRTICENVLEGILLFEEIPQRSLIVWPFLLAKLKQLWAETKEEKVGSSAEPFQEFQQLGLVRVVAEEEGPQKADVKVLRRELGQVGPWKDQAVEW